MHEPTQHACPQRGLHSKLWGQHKLWGSCTARAMLVAQAPGAQLASSGADLAQAWCLIWHHRLPGVWRREARDIVEASSSKSESVSRSDSSRSGVGLLRLCASLASS